MIPRERSFGLEIMRGLSNEAASQIHRDQRNKSFQILSYASLKRKDAIRYVRSEGGVRCLYGYVYDYTSGYLYPYV
jgi:hypothetical protein